MKQRPLERFQTEIMHLGAVILAAGASSRMGRPKLLLPWGQTSVIGHLVEQWAKTGATQIVTVLSHHDEALPRELDRLACPKVGRIINLHPEQGMFSSIQCAARWEGWDAAISHIVILLGDQPHLRPETLRQLIAFAALNAASITQPSLHGRAKHPVVFPRADFQKLQTTQATTLAEFLSTAGPSALCASEDAGLDLDLDQPCDYERACAMVFGRSSPGG